MKKTLDQIVAENMKRLHKEGRFKSAAALSGACHVSKSAIGYLMATKAQFQNGFGAYVAVTYECDFDPASNGCIQCRHHPGASLTPIPIPLCEGLQKTSGTPTQAPPDP